MVMLSHLSRRTLCSKETYVLSTSPAASQPLLQGSMWCGREGALESLRSSISMRRMRLWLNMRYVHGLLPPVSPQSLVVNPQQSSGQQPLRRQSWFAYASPCVLSFFLFLEIPHLNYWAGFQPWNQCIRAFYALVSDLPSGYL